MTRPRAWLVGGALVLAAATACGKKGPPLPPLRPVPGRVADLSARVVDARVAFTFTVPAANADGTRPPALDRVEIYGLASAEGDPAPSPAAIAEAANLVATVAVTRAGAAAPVGAPAGLVRHGDRVELDETLEASVPDAVYRYVAVGVTGRRRGAFSPVLAVTLAERPAAPRGLLFEYDQSTLSLSWLGEADIRYSVYETTEAAEPDRLTGAPVAEPAFATPVAFDRLRCFHVRAVRTEGPVAIESAPSRPICVTAVDRFPPPPPTALQAVAAAGAVELTWRGVDAADLVGYLVLRGTGGGETLVPLTAAPVAGQSYRDATVTPGDTYTYAVVALDGATPPNHSAESNRRVVTAR